MGRIWGLLLFLGGCSGFSSHSLRHFYWGETEPGQGLPWFAQLGYVDDQLFVQYDSNTRKELPRAPWMERIVEEEDRQYWERETQFSQAAELNFKVALMILQNRYNQSRGNLPERKVASTFLSVVALLIPSFMVVAAALVGIILSIQRRQEEPAYGAASTGLSVLFVLMLILVVVADAHRLVVGLN